MKITNRSYIDKKVANDADIKKIINLINRVKVKKISNESLSGEGYIVAITYSNGEKISLGFLSTTLEFKCNEFNASYVIDKNILDGLDDIYNEA
ncbi:hypothetical protein IAI10_00845 [Clostridium sp. 19966]|uniref:hypothetical protein n=1 Tax=Clostridium sp. 19966 TaxID=2768166 RepID=UPI0028DEBDEB|nr:hypothetical protein [Clostridium sp. 19966]MDT8715228.1 hypothetical protein [Clostridium sp. 19966]